MRLLFRNFFGSILVQVHIDVRSNVWIQIDRVENLIVNLEVEERLALWNSEIVCALDQHWLSRQLLIIGLCTHLIEPVDVINGRTNLVTHHV